MRTSTRLLVGLAVAGCVAAGGSAFTAGNSLAVDNIAGYGEAVVTGATASSIRHTLSANGQSILSTAIVFTSAIKNSNTVSAGFNGGAQTVCTPSTTTGTSTQFTCSYSPAVTTSTATSFSVSVV